jgi:hypothetical protein
VTQVLEPVHAAAVAPKPVKKLAVTLESVTFDSGIELYEVAKGGSESLLPPAGTPHWTKKASHPAVYVREGGSGETKELKCKVRWAQQGFDGKATLEGRSKDGSITISGDFDISGANGSAEFDCTFTKRPDKVANHGGGIGFRWRATTSGGAVNVDGGGVLRLFFVDAKPKPIAWSLDGYPAHYLKVVDWATRWAAGKAGSSDVLAAIWSRFSTGTGARVPHATGFVYWRTNDPVQDLRTLIQPDGGVLKKGWSCRAIAHTFMECLAIHGITCLEVVPNCPSTAKLFLVQNWDVAASPLPNWSTRTDLYYAGSWVSSDLPPLNKPVATELRQDHGAVAPKKDPLLKIDMKKRPGVPAQGQPLAPLGFSNHWIVEVGGQLYDTSYGGVHPNSMSAYASASIAGWLVYVLKDKKVTAPGSWLTKVDSRAWLGHPVATHALVRQNGQRN